MGLQRDASTSAMLDKSFRANPSVQVNPNYYAGKGGEDDEDYDDDACYIDVMSAQEDELDRIPPPVAARSPTLHTSANGTNSTEGGSQNGSVPRGSLKISSLHSGRVSFSKNSSSTSLLGKAALADLENTIDEYGDTEETEANDEYLDLEEGNPTVESSPTLSRDDEFQSDGQPLLDTKTEQMAPDEFPHYEATNECEPSNVTAVNTRGKVKKSQEPPDLPPARVPFKGRSQSVRPSHANPMSRTSGASLPPHLQPDFGHSPSHDGRHLSSSTMVTGPKQLNVEQSERPPLPMPHKAHPTTNQNRPLPNPIPGFTAMKASPMRKSKSVRHQPTSPREDNGPLRPVGLLPPISQEGTYYSRAGLQPVGPVQQLTGVEGYYSPASLNVTASLPDRSPSQGTSNPPPLRPVGLERPTTSTDYYTINK